MNVRKLVKSVFKVDIKQMSTKRKYPINPEDIDKLPVFEYSVSKRTYNRLFAWGCAATGALGIPYRKQEINKTSCIGFPKRLPLAEYNEVTHISCGYGFTVFGINSDNNTKLFGTGLNTDSQLGYHEIQKNKPLEVLFLPQPIYLPLEHPKTTKIKKISSGRAHLVVLTDEGIFLLGNNAFGQCGRTIIVDEQYNGSKYINHIKNVDNKKIVDVECGQDHTMVLTDDGSVYSCGWGADGQTGLGYFNNQSQFSKVQGDISSERIVKLSSKGDFVLALNEKGDVFGWGNCEYGQLILEYDEQQTSVPRFIKMCNILGQIIDVAAGGTFCMVLNAKGEIYVWGYGLLGAGSLIQCSEVPINIPSVLFCLNDFQLDSKVSSIACGLSHFCAITKKGDLYTWGRNKQKCLGLGHEKDQYFPLRVSLGGFVKTVSCGVDHTIALCKPFI